MPVQVHISMQGARELQQTFQRLKPSKRRSIARRGITKAARLVAKTARREAPVRTRTLKRDIKHKVRTKGNFVFGVVGPIRGGPAWYAQIVHEGSKPRAHKGGKSVGRMKPNPFLKRAFDATKSQVSSILKRETAAGLEKEARKAAR